MEKETVILLLSGGIDSTTLLAKLKLESYEVICLSFNYNQRNNVELLLAQNNSKKYGALEHIILNIPDESFKSSALVNTSMSVLESKTDSIGEQRVNTYVPFRNLVFCSMALSNAETRRISKIFIAVNYGDSKDYWDCRPEFFESLNAISGLSSDIKIETPFINYSKKEIIKIAKELNVDLNNTISCYQPIERNECGVCLSCLMKNEALISY